MSQYSHLQSPKQWRNKNQERKPARLYLMKLFDKILPSKSPEKRKSHRIKKLIWSAFIILFVSGLLGGVALTGAFIWFGRNLPDPNKIIERAVPESTKIYDRSGETIIYEIHGDKKRTLVNLEDITNYAKWATITSEDKDFYKHSGFNLKGILRAIIMDVLQGSKSQGGSTITQQLIKNSILSNEKSYIRKIKELILSYRIEKKFSKDEILKMYFNEIPYGSVIYGIESASETFFGKSAKNLTLAESATLAVIPRATTFYSPYGTHTDELFAREKTLLDQMAEAGYITKDEAEAAKQEKVSFRLQDQNIIAPHFVMYVKDLLAQEYGDKVVEEGGLKVYTTLDLYKQKIAEEAIANRVEANKKYNAYNTALISLDPKTGEILAMVGSKDYFGESEPEGCNPGLNCKFEPNVNVTLRPRQPGSSFKPIVYATAFKKGYTPDTILYDVDTVFKTDTMDYEPHNYNGKEYGPITMRNALAGSLNIPAVKTIYLAGVDKVLDLADELGYTTLKDRSRFGLSLVLGGGEVKLLEHAEAFSSFAREGEQHETTAILKVLDKNGKILEEHHDTSKKIFDAEIARQINSIISDNAARSFIFGEKNYLTLGDRPVAAKTGTTNDNHDAWAMGFTPSIVAGVWVGNNDNTAMKAGADGSVVAAPIWHEYMDRVLGKTPIEQFNAPKPLQTDKPILTGKIADEVTVKIDRASGKLATDLTPPSFVVEKSYRQLHDILYYVEKDNPQGPAPEHPEDDPQYANWEVGVRKWAEKQGTLTTELPPTEYDDVHILANQPTINIISPMNNATVSEPNMEIRVNAGAPRGMSRVEYYIDGQLIGSSRLSPFNLSYFFSGFDNGFHTLKAIALDDIDNFQSTQIDLNLLLKQTGVSTQWLNPQNNSSFYISNFPLLLSLSVINPENIERLDFYYATGNEIHLISSVYSPKETAINLGWPNAPLAGQYRLYAEIIDKSGNLQKSREIILAIL
jgi:1A family penicillin-binding protein